MFMPGDVFRAVPDRAVRIRRTAWPSQEKIMTEEMIVGIIIGFSLGVAVMAVRAEIKHIIWREKLRRQIGEHFGLKSPRGFGAE